MQRFSNKIISPHAELTLVRFLELANEWLWDCEIRQCSSTTLANRKLVLDKFHWWLLHENLLHEKLHTNIFRSFFLYLRNAHKTPQGRFGGNCPAAFREPKPATLLLYYSVLRTFCNWLTREGVLSESPFQLIPSPLLRQKQIAPLNNQQIQQLLDATQKTFPPLRNQALILFLLDTGLRISEALRLNVSDLDLRHRQVSVLGKGNKTRTVFYGLTTARALSKYLRWREQQQPHTNLSSAPLFASVYGNGTVPLTPTAVQILFRRLSRNARFPHNVTPHTLRHTFAVHFLRNGGNQFALMQLLGHTSLGMTKRYVALALADVQQQHQNFSPVDRLPKRK